MAKYTVLPSWILVLFFLLDLPSDFFFPTPTVQSVTLLLLAFKILSCCITFLLEPDIRKQVFFEGFQALDLNFTVVITLK